MKYLFKTLIVMWLCLTLPVQGLAATATLLCGHSHHGDAVMAFAGSAVLGDYAHADAGIADTHESNAIEGGGSSDTHCNACAACCSGALMPPPNPRTVAAPEGLTVIPFPPLAVSSAVPGTLDRPPLSPAL